MKVALVSEGTYPYAMGGVSVWCDQLMRGLSDYRWEMVALTVDGRSGRCGGSPTTSTAWSPSRCGAPESAAPAQPARPPEFTEPYAGVPRQPRHPAGSAAGPGGRGPRAVPRRAARRCTATPRPAATCRRAHDVQPGAGDDDGRLARDPRGRADAGRRHPGGLAAGAHAAAAGGAGGRGRRRARVDERAVDARRARRRSGRTAPRCCSPSTASTCASGTSPTSTTTRRTPVKVLVLNFFRCLAGAAYLACDALAPHSGYNRRWQLRNGADPERMWTMYNGVAPESFPPALEEPDEPTIVFVGRIDPLKDLHTLIRAFAIVREKMPAARLRMFGGTPTGNGSYEDSCLALIEELGLTGAADAGGPGRRHGRRLPQRQHRRADQHLRGLPVHRRRGDGVRPRRRVHQRRRRVRGGRRRRLRGRAARRRRGRRGLCAAARRRARSARSSPARRATGCSNGSRWPSRWTPTAICTSDWPIRRITAAPATPRAERTLYVGRVAIRRYVGRVARGPPPPSRPPASRCGRRTHTSAGPRRPTSTPRRGRVTKVGAADPIDGRCRRRPPW